MDIGKDCWADPRGVFNIDLEGYWTYAAKVLEEPKTSRRGRLRVSYNFYQENIDWLFPLINSMGLGLNGGGKHWKHDFQCDCLEVTGTSPLFEEVEEGCEMPAYTFVFHEENKELSSIHLTKY